jgi:hypothetical protein
MTPSDSAVLLKMQDTLQEIIAGIKAIQHVLYDKGITDPQSLQQVHNNFRKLMDEMPEGKSLKNLLALLDDKHSV